MDKTAYRMLYDSIHDFKATAALVESEIKRYGVRSKSVEVRGGPHSLHNLAAKIRCSRVVVDECCR